MAEAISTAASSMELALKDTNVGGLIVDMTPTTAALLHHNALALRSLKEAAAASASESEQPEPRSLATTPTPTPTNLSTGPHSPPMTFRCERCDNFETSSRATLLLHVVQCLAGQAAAAAAVAVRLKSEGHEEPENMSVSHMDSCKQEPAADAVGGSSSSASSSPAGNGNGNGNGNSSGNASRKVFECDVCNMKFSNGANMRRHKMRHTGVKPYECRVCQKRFFRKDHLAEHFTTHTKTLPYHCPICNRGFQRQIAMRAHFQNEHVGQHDLVKTCPLCSYRAGSMKSLRIHFFNRHGIDLDNPGPGGTSSLLLALESQASAAAAAAAAAAAVSYSQPQLSNVQPPPPLPPTAAPPSAPASHQSDSGESMRSLENATPPMHFLTPHVEISTLNESGNTELFNGNNNNNNNNNCNSNNNNNNNTDLESSCEQMKEHPLLLAPQDLPMDCKATPITSSTTTSLSSSKSHHSHAHAHAHAHHPHHHPHSHPHSHHHENHITPSISLIPIKQEPLLEDADKKDSLNGSAACDANSDTEIAANNNNNNSNNNNNNNRITSLIKVSPLKSLLREDLKRRICAKANNRITRNATPLEHELQSLPQTMLNGGGAGGAAGGGTGATTPTTPAGGSHNGNSAATPICNGTITSTGQESELQLNRKQILTCHFCGIEFPDETLYFLHKGCHCESNPWKCNICGEQLNNVYEFNAHLLSKSHQ
ncbi:protein sister of odd and bowel isoform X2 [Drosophila montana]|uniref:protein sister of odd and bowel isoform X2 n=1 Tax=Drosophila montana TaxID=40370 RepID=UPI00313CB12B